MSVPEGAQRSEDGHYWWDGADWQPVPADDPQAPGASGASGEVTPEQLAQISSEDQIDDQLHPYFAPDYDMYADDTSQAEGADQVSDEPAEGGA